MKLNVQNSKNETVDTVELNEGLFGGRVKTDLIWASVVQQNAAERRGTHATKNRALVSGGGKKPYKQKGTGRPQVGSSRTPLWRKGGTVFGPQPRSYEYDMPKKVQIGALRAAFAQKLNEGVVIVVDRFEAADNRKTKSTAEMLRRFGVSGKTLLIDQKPDEAFALTARNIAGLKLLATGGVTARDIMDTSRVIVTRAALEKLTEALT
jgi:large subunit ribosomal protein L4